MKIGKFDVSVIETGYLSLDGGAMFGIVPKNLWSKTNPPDELNRIILSMRLMIIKYDDRIMITDCGVGNKLKEKLSSIYKINHSKYDLISSLRGAGIMPQQVTDVIITHLHFDHIGGATFIDDQSQFQLTFPNAMHHVQKDQWKWALNPSEKDGASYMDENYLPIKEAGRLNLIDGAGEFLPGMELLTFNGHTPMMQAPKISDGTKTVFYTADIFPHSSHLPLPYIMGYDIEPLKTLAEKKKLLPKIVDEEWLLIFEHDPYNVAGKAERTEKGYKLKESFSKL